MHFGTESFDFFPICNNRVLNILFKVYLYPKKLLS